MQRLEHFLCCLIEQFAPTYLHVVIIFQFPFTQHAKSFVFPPSSSKSDGQSYWAAWENFSSGLADAPTKRAQPIPTLCSPDQTNLNAEQVFILKYTNQLCLCRTREPMLSYSVWV